MGVGRGAALKPGEAWASAGLARREASGANLGVGGGGGSPVVGFGSGSPRTYMRGVGCGGWPGPGSGKFGEAGPPRNSFGPGGGGGVDGPAGGWVIMLLRSWSWP